MFDHGIMAQHTKEELSCFCCRSRSAPVPWLSPEFMEDTASTPGIASMARTQWFILENGFKNQPMLHPPRKQTWHLKIDTRKRRFLLETIPSIFKLSLRLCTNPWVFNRPMTPTPHGPQRVSFGQLCCGHRKRTTVCAELRSDLVSKITGPKSIQRWNKVTKSEVFIEDVFCFLFFLRESKHVAARILGSVKEGSWW